MSNPIPTSLALTNIAPGAQILSADQRNNYSAVQVAVNALITALSGGSAGQVLQAASASAVQWATTGGLYRKTTAKTVASSVAETDLLNGEITIAAGVLGTSSLLRLTAYGDWKQNSGAATPTPRFKVKLGATTLLDTGAMGVTPMGNSAVRFGWRMVCEIANLGAANAQWATLEGRLGAAAGADASGTFTTGEGVAATASVGGNPGVTTYLGGNTGAVDTSGAQALALAVILPAASANCDIVLKGALVEVI